ncbi:MAG: hypothetical protein HY690_18780 [Chloroflexi bacterium]|nr:hypothetical protein [Chloroflexota bacterium]
MLTTPRDEGQVGYRFARSWAEVRALLGDADLFPLASSYALLARADRVELVALQRALEDELLAAAWPAGHAFNARCEVQWTRRGDGYELRLLAEAAPPAGWEACGRYEVGEEVALLLFGQRKPGQACWRETRIPRELSYPVAGTGRARLVAVPYRRDGMTLRYRWKGVRADGLAGA